MAEYSELKQQILSDIKRDTRLASNGIKQKIANKTVTYDDAVKYSKAIGDAAGKALERYKNDVVEEALTEYAEEVLAPVYRAVQNSTLTASRQTQQTFLDNMGLGISPVNVKPDESRIAHMIARFRNATSFDEVAFLLGSDVAENVARGSVTDSIKQNADFMDSAGIEVSYTRSGVGCCAWCDSMTGTYARGELPDDFWRVHKDCTCSFDIKARNSRTRITYSTSDGKITKNTTSY